MTESLGAENLDSGFAVGPARRSGWWPGSAGKWGAADGHRGGPHDQEGDDQQLLAADPGAEVAEHGSTERASDEGDAERGEGGQRSRGRAEGGEELVAEHQGRRGAEDEELVPLDRGPDEADRPNHDCGAPLTTDDRIDLSSELDNVLADVGIKEADSGGDITFTGDDPIVPSVLPTASAASLGLVAKSVAIAALWRHRGGGGQDIAMGCAADEFEDAACSSLAVDESAGRAGPEVTVSTPPATAGTTCSPSRNGSCSRVGLPSTQPNPRPMTARTVVSLLSGLVARSLVQLEHISPDRGRYRILEPLHRYDQGRLAEHGEDAVIAERGAGRQPGD